MWSKMRDLKYDLICKYSCSRNRFSPGHPINYSTGIKGDIWKDNPNIAGSIDICICRKFQRRKVLQLHAQNVATVCRYRPITYYTMEKLR